MTIQYEMKIKNLMHVLEYLMIFYHEKKKKSMFTNIKLFEKLLTKRN